VKLIPQIRAQEFDYIISQDIAVWLLSLVLMKIKMQDLLAQQMVTFQIYTAKYV
jgi:hypothetical protein